MPLTHTYVRIFTLIVWLVGVMAHSTHTSFLHVGSTNTYTLISLTYRIGLYISIYVREALFLRVQVNSLYCWVASFQHIYFLLCSRTRHIVSSHLLPTPIAICLSCFSYSFCTINSAAAATTTTTTAMITSAYFSFTL